MKAVPRVFVGLVSIGLWGGCGDVGAGNKAAQGMPGVGGQLAPRTGTGLDSGTGGKGANGGGSGGSPAGGEGGSAPVGAAGGVAGGSPAAGLPVATGGPCASAPKATAAQAGNPPSVYGASWTAAPTEGCTFTDGDGRVVNLTAAQHRMIFRVNEVRALQSAADGRKRSPLEADYCLQEFSQGYAESKPGGHSAMNLSFYRIPGGGQGTGGNFIGENYGAHGGYTDDAMAAVDRLINGWWNSGDTDRGHRGNMLDPEWTKGGMGVVVRGSSALGIQTFSRKYANWLSGWQPCSQPPKQDDPQSTIPLPIMR